MYPATPAARRAGSVCLPSFAAKEWTLLMFLSAREAAVEFTRCGYPPCGKRGEVPPEGAEGSGASVEASVCFLLRFKAS